MLVLVANRAQAAIPERKGWWKFDAPSDLMKAESGYGIDLNLVGTQSAVAGPENENGAILIGAGSYYKMQHSISPNGGGTQVNEYSIQYDFKVSENGVWHSFFQTTVNNTDDGDFFINTSGNIGVAAAGYSSYSIIPGEWYRLLISVKNGSGFTCYLDGKLILNGKIQSIDGRFSFNDMLLIFADDNGEDTNIYCSELSIWDQALDAEQASELGGLGHKSDSFLMTRIPYLQGQGPNSMYVCWHDEAQTGTKVEYGTDPATLSISTLGTSEEVSLPYRWHSVKLTGLQANTRYFYRVLSGNGASKIYSFKTSPDDTYTGKIRFVLLSDTHSSDSTAVGKVLRAAKAKITELYGPDIENQVNGIFHSGDIVVNGNSPSQYTTQYFRPLAVLSANIPTMVVAGNHEAESPYFYQYLKLDDQSAFPQTPALKEKVWQVKIGNSLFIGLNTNITAQYGTTEAGWLDSKLNEAENDPSIDFVFLFFHHLPFSELWNVSETRTNYVKNTLFPFLKKYSKVQQLHYGHTHGFERGTIMSEKADGDFRIICGGGGGGTVDPWASSLNHDYNDIHICYNHNFFQILEIDIANHSFENSMYSIGNQNDPRNSELMDRWHKIKNQKRPNTPTIDNWIVANESIQFNTSQFSGLDAIMSVQFQVIEHTENSRIVMDSLVHWKNSYGIDSDFRPIDKNDHTNLYQTTIKTALLSSDKNYLFHVRYRDQNLKWSGWSNSVSFNIDEIINGTEVLTDFSDEYWLSQNYPNPFQHQTTFTYNIPENAKVVLRIYDQDGRLVDEINEGVKHKGTYHIDYNAKNLESAMYFYKLITNKLSMTKKMIKMN